MMSLLLFLATAAALTGLVLAVDTASARRQARLLNEQPPIPGSPPRVDRSSALGRAAASKVSTLSHPFRGVRDTRRH